MKKIFFIRAFILSLCIVLLSGTGYALVIGPAPSPVTSVTITPVDGFDVSGAPSRLAVDSIGRIYVTDPIQHAVLVFSHNGILLDSFDGIGRPVGLALDGSDTIYVGDVSTGSVMMLDSSGVLQGKLGRRGR